MGDFFLEVVSLGAEGMQSPSPLAREGGKVEEVEVVEGRQQKEIFLPFPP